jgi:hypothetical protein
MKARELSQEEWAKFFDAFSRQFRGRRMTLGLSEAAEGRADTLAEGLPLVGITVEPPHGPAESIVVMLGDSPHGHVSHVVRAPCRVRIVQVNSGEDDVVIVDSSAGPATRIDFRDVPPEPEPDLFAECMAELEPHRA